MLYIEYRQCRMNSLLYDYAKQCMNIIKLLCTQLKIPSNSGMFYSFYIPNQKHTVLIMKEINKIKEQFKEQGIEINTHCSQGGAAIGLESKTGCEVSQNVQYINYK